MAELGGIWSSWCSASFGTLHPKPVAVLQHHMPTSGVIVMRWGHFTFERDGALSHLMGWGYVLNELGSLHVYANISRFIMHLHSTRLSPSAHIDAHHAPINKPPLSTGAFMHP